MVPSLATPGIMARLKEETQPLHDRAETHSLQKTLAQGLISKDAYVAYLTQLFHVHSALDEALTAAAKQDERVGGLVESQHLQTQYLVADLGFFMKCPAHVAAGAGAKGLVEQIRNAAKASPVSVLGFHYVMLGSTNGGRFIAKSLRRAFGLEQDGVRYFDPWGEHQRELWLDFKRAMDATAFTPAEMDAILDAAKAMFEGIARVSDDVAAQTKA